MKMRLVPLLLCFTLLCLPVLAAAPPSDDAAIRAVVEQYMQARNQKDQAALVHILASDADQLVSTGEWRRGSHALVQGGMASSQKENGRSSLTVESVRLIGRGAAIADCRYETSAAGSGTPRKMWSTFVLERTPAGWRIAAIRNMLPALAQQK